MSIAQYLRSFIFIYFETNLPINPVSERSPLPYIG